MIIILFQSGLGDPRKIVAGMRSLDIPFLDGNGNMFRQFNMSCTSDFVINFANFLYGTEGQPHLTRFFIISMDCSIYPMCSCLAHVCRCAGDKNLGCFQIKCCHGNQ